MRASVGIALAERGSLRGRHLVKCDSGGIKPCYSGYRGCGTNGFVEVNLSADVNGGAMCGATNPAWAVIDISSSSGNAIYTLLPQARFFRPGPLYVYGTGSCTINPTMETIGVVFF